MADRIIEKVGLLRREVFAPRTELFWDPITEKGYVRFHLEEFSVLDGELVNRTPKGTMERSFDAIMPRTWQVPDGNGGFIPVPTLLVMGAIKTALNTLYDESNAPALGSPESFSNPAA